MEANHPDELFCGICYLELEEPRDFQHFGCGHMFCFECIKEFLEYEISQGNSCLSMKCPTFDCDKEVPSDLISDICGAKQYKMFKKLKMDDLLIRCVNLKPCKGNNCSKVFKIEKNMFYQKSYNGRKIKAIKSFNMVCDCLYSACSNCSEEPHSPQTCQGSAHWKELIGTFTRNEINMDDIKNQIWIEKNSKICPKCKVNIQKNEGCMHMTCRNCHHHFCWMCGGDWSQHGSQTGGYYKCNLYNPKQHDRKKNTKLTESMEVYNKIEFYLKRFTNHMKSCSMMKKRINAIQVKFNKRSKTHLSRWNSFIMPNSLNFYLEAYKLCYKTRIFIANTYPLMMKIKTKMETQLFADNIFFMEMTLENLHKELIDHPIERMIDILSFGGNLKENIKNPSDTNESVLRKASGNISDPEIENLLLQKKKSTMSYLSNISHNSNNFLNSKKKKPKKNYPVYTETPQLSDFKIKINKMFVQLENQFYHAQQTFKNDLYTRQIELAWEKQLLEFMKEVTIKKKKEAKKKQQEFERRNWYCRACTFYNQNRDEQVCEICRTPR